MESKRVTKTHSLMSSVCGGITSRLVKPGLASNASATRPFHSRNSFLMPSRAGIALTSLTEPLEGVDGLAMLFQKRTVTRNVVAHAASRSGLALGVGM